MLLTQVSHLPAQIQKHKHKNNNKDMLPDLIVHVKLMGKDMSLKQVQSILSHTF